LGVAIWLSYPVKGLTMNRRLAPACYFLSVALFSILLAGCNDTDPVNPIEPPPPGAGPVLDSEPEFSPGNENTLAWSLADDGKAGSADWEFLVQRSSDPLFENDVQESGWIGSMSFEFTGLAHGSANYYRVQGQNPQGIKTEWSANQTSIQDAEAPIATLGEMKTEQTSLLFLFEMSATDETSGLKEIELWFGMDGEEPFLFGTFQPGEVRFQATQGGTHDFFPVAIDMVGNRQDAGATPAATTIVPEPIIITDMRGEDFDITAAVLEYRMGVDFWEFGLGRFTILPVIDPLMIGPGDFGYPRDDNTVEVLAVNYEGDSRAYKIGDLPDKEVVDDVVNGTPIAVSY
jgi:hypothetical protein